MWTETLQVHKQSQQVLSIHTFQLIEAARTCLIILASSDPCLFYCSWCERSTSLPYCTLSSCKKTEPSKVRREQAWSVPVGPCPDCHVFMAEPCLSSHVTAILAETYPLLFFSFYLSRISLLSVRCSGLFLCRLICRWNSLLSFCSLVYLIGSILWLDM